MATNAGFELCDQGLLSSKSTIMDVYVFGNSFKLYQSLDGDLD